MIQTVWEQPMPAGVYAVGGDPAEGLEKGDDSVLSVINCLTGHQVAEVQGKIPPKEFGEMAGIVGEYYNNALVAIENNKDGGANQYLYDFGYKNIYFQREVTARAYDKSTDKLGYNMNGRTRPILVAQGRQWMEDGSAIPRSMALLSQFETFVLRKGKYEALPGGHDDLVIAWFLAIEMARIRLQSIDASKHTQLPTVNGEEIDPYEMEDIDEWEKGVDYSKVDVDRMIAQADRNRKKEPFYHPSTVDALV